MLAGLYTIHPYFVESSVTLYCGILSLYVAILYLKGRKGQGRVGGEGMICRSYLTSTTLQFT